MKKFLATSIIILTLLYLASVGWLYAHHLLFYRRVALEEPIRLEEGFSVRGQFTVDMRTLYWVAIQYDEIFRSTAELPTPRDEFTAEFDVTSQNKVITKGSSATYPDLTGSWASSRDDVTRYLGSFDGRPGEVYQLSLRIMRTQPRLVPKRAKVIIEVERNFDEFRRLRESLLLAVGIVIAILGFTCCWSMLRSRRRDCTSAM